MKEQESIIKDAEIVKADGKSSAEGRTKHSGRGLGVAAIIIAVITLLLTIGNSVAILGLAASVTYNGASYYSFEPDGNSANFVEGSIAEVAGKVSDSVVSIITETKTKSYSFWYGETEDTGAAAGTGIIVSEDGYVLTNKHVIEGATKVYIITDDGTAYKDVELKAVDPLNDVAYLKINGAENLVVATLGDSKTIAIGQQVIAIGNALGQYQNSVTSGIVSGAGRSITASDGTYQNVESLTDMIQTDAAINSGNSGGPLVNAAGEVIGINTAVSDGNGIGFAIPISAVKGMLDSLLETGTAKRAYAGISYTNIDVALAIEEDLPVTAGALVRQAMAGSPADKAGLKAEDIIVAVNGIKLGANRSLGTLLGECKVGDTIRLTVLRNGSELALDLTLAEYAE
ncbi:trypsin-like peptidase domain-containing protein [Candidatus Saccharibacteria bacterium]|nr:trypsin-like peptidase domain-containing protein [Candidatus Saccharibacteria bacterium]